MIPTSYQQIVETGRQRQGELLAAAQRERRVMQATTEAPAPETAFRPHHINDGVGRVSTARSRLTGLLGWVPRPRFSQS